MGRSQVSPTSIIFLVLRPFGSVHPRVAQTAFIDQSAQVIGDVDIGADSSVWMNAVIRGDVNSIRVGRRTNIQDGCVVHVMSGSHPTSLGDDVTIGHGAILHGCTVEDRCLMSMGVVPSRSLVMGNPGRVRRMLTDDEVASIRRYSEHYVEYKNEYRSL